MADRRVGLAAAGLIVLQVGYRCWAVFQGFFFEDDFKNLYDATHSSLSLDLLFRGVNGHLKPGGYLLIWVLQHLAPMNFTLVALVLVTFQVVASITVWALLRELVGARWGALLPLAVYLFSPLTLSSYLWYAASIETVMLQFVMAGALLFHVRYLRGGRRSDAAISVSFFVFGLVNWEKTLLVLPVLVLVTVFWFSTGGIVRRVVGAATAHWRLWTTHLVVVVGYVALYLSRVGMQLGSERAVSTPRLAWEGIAKGFVPALFGGPYRAPGADVPAGLTAAFIVLLVLIIAVTVFAERTAWRAWCFLAVYLALDVLLLAGSGRGGVLGPEVGRDVRFFADASVVAAVAIAMAIYPPGRLPSRLPRWDIGRSLDRPMRTGALILVYLVSCSVTSAKVVDAWSATSAEPFVRTAQADIRAIGRTVIYDAPPPDDVLAPWFLEDHLLSRVLAPLPERPRFDEPTAQLYEVTPQGHLVPADLHVAANGVVGSSADCPTRVDNDAHVSIPTTTALFDWRWVVRLDFSIESGAAISVTAGGDRHTAVVGPSGHRLFVVVSGAVDHVDVGLFGASAPLCVTAVAIGTVGPKP